MTQSFIQPKGTLKSQINIEDLQKQYAQAFTTPQLQAQATQTETNPMRQTINDLIKTKLMPVDMPKFTTIQDVFNAPKGEKLNTFGSYLNTPAGQNVLGGLLSLVSGGEYFATQNDPYNQYLQQDMLTKQAQAMQKLKDQDSLVANLNDAYNRMDIANEQNKLRRDLAKEELEWRKQENALDRALKRDSLNAQIAHQRAMESIARDKMNGTATGGASGLSEKQLQKNIESLNSLNAVQSQMDRFSNSFDKVRPTKAGALLANTYASKGFGNGAESNFNAQRTLLFNKIARELGGEKGVLSDQDIKRIESSLPSLSDSLPQKRAKMKAVYDLLEDRKSQYGGGTASNNDPMGLGL